MKKEKGSISVESAWFLEGTLAYSDPMPLPSAARKGLLGTICIGVEVYS